MKKLLIVIDPQIDFCDIPEEDVGYKSTLPVFGANEDMKRLSKTINNYDFSDIIVSLDTHEKFDIAHPTWWIDEKNQHPAPFTKITASDVYQEVWKPVESDNFWYAYDYLNALYENNKYTHIIWPEHCIKDSIGQKIHPVLNEEFGKWETKNNKKITYIEKGKNPLTEHYSLFKAEIPIEDDVSTQVDNELMNKISSYDFIFISGEALSHCVKSSVLDLLDYIEPSKIIFLVDTSSPVQGFEDDAANFIKMLKEKGVVLMSTSELIF